MSARQSRDRFRVRAGRGGDVACASQEGHLGDVDRAIAGRRRGERDGLAEQLREVYPDSVAKIVDLFTRIKVNNEALSTLHQARPAGVQLHLYSAELEARGIEAFTRDVPSLLDSVHLIDWESGREVWPSPRPSMAAAFAAVEPPHDSHRFTADWAKDNEKRAAAQRAEQQRIADYYARATKEQEQRENAEARELFLAQQQRMTRKP